MTSPPPHVSQTTRTSTAPATGIRTDLPLAVLLYFNVLQSAVYAVFTPALLVAGRLRASAPPPLGGAVPPAAFVLWSAVEATRLRLGRRGNAAGSVPDLAVAALLTAVQLPVVAYLSFRREGASPCDAALGGAGVVFLAAECGAAACALRRLAGEGSRAQCGDADGGRRGR